MAFIEDRIKRLSGELGQVENEKEKLKSRNQLDIETEAKISFRKFRCCNDAKQLELTVN